MFCQVLRKIYGSISNCGPIIYFQSNSKIFFHILRTRENYFCNIFIYLFLTVWCALTNRSSQSIRGFGKSKIFCDSHLYFAKNLPVKIKIVINDLLIAFFLCQFYFSSNNNHPHVLRCYLSYLLVIIKS